MLPRPQLIQRYRGLMLVVLAPVNEYFSSADILFHADLQTPQGTMTIVVTPDTGFASMAGMGTQTMPADQKNETLEQIKRDPIFIGSHWRDPDVFFHAGGTEKVGNIDSRIVDVNAAGTAIRWFVNPADGHILKETYRTTGRNGPAEGETAMDDWKSVDGLTIPLQRKNKQNGEETSMSESSPGVYCERRMTNVDASPENCTTARGRH